MSIRTPLWLVVVLVALACTRPDAPAPAMAGNIDLVQAARYLREFDDLCSEDGGRLWGVSLCGPTLLVDPATRAVVADGPDDGGVLRPDAGLFTGTLPDDLGVANTAVSWGGKRWTMIIWWALGEDRPARQALMAHEAFHRVQPDLNLTPVGEVNAHLDGADGRYWMQLEWNALQQALLADGTARSESVADALTFRAARRSAFPDAAARETPLEIFEGVAEYTGMRLAGFSPRQVVEAVSGKRETNTGFVRSFAYVSGPLYGYLLDDAAVDWRGRLEPDTDLGALLAASLRVSAAPTDEAERRAASYDGPALRATEGERERERAARVAAWREALVDGPVLILDLNAVISVTFDPRKVFPIGEGQTVYTTRGLIAEWGLLTVEDGAILEDRTTGRAHVSLSGAADDFAEGQGWTLQLDSGWEVVAADRPGDFVVRSAGD